jgi:hypothetical protein
MRSRYVICRWTCHARDQNRVEETDNSIRFDTPDSLDLNGDALFVSVFAMQWFKISLLCMFIFFTHIGMLSICMIFWSISSIKYLCQMWTDYDTLKHDNATRPADECGFNIVESGQVRYRFRKLNTRKTLPCRL